MRYCWYDKSNSYCSEPFDSYAEAKEDMLDVASDAADVYQVLPVSKAAASEDLVKSMAATIMWHLDDSGDWPLDEPRSQWLWRDIDTAQQSLHKALLGWVDRTIDFADDLWRRGALVSEPPSPEIDS